MLTRYRADDASLQACLEQRQSFHVDDDTTDAVRSILNAVRESGDAALRDLTARFDGVEMPAERLRVTASEIRGAAVSPDLLGALERAAGRIRAFHERELRNDWWHLGSEGGALGQTYVAQIGRAHV